MATTPILFHHHLILPVWCAEPRSKIVGIIETGRWLEHVTKWCDAMRCDAQPVSQCYKSSFHNTSRRYRMLGLIDWLIWTLQYLDPHNLLIVHSFDHFYTSVPQWADYVASKATLVLRGPSKVKSTRQQSANSRKKIKTKTVTSTCKGRPSLFLALPHSSNPIHAEIDLIWIDSNRIEVE